MHQLLSPEVLSSVDHPPLEFAIPVTPAVLAEINAAADETIDGKSDPREVLDAVKRATIVALVRLGASRRMAAGEVGCAPRTIARTAARKPQFAAELAQAESRSDRKALQLIDRATDQEKYWRAAAWVLERRNPEEFGRRAPHTHTSDAVLKLFTSFLHNVLPKLPAECREVLLEQYEDVISDLTGDAKAAAAKKKLQVVDEAPVPAPPLLEAQCPRDEAAAQAWLAKLSIEQLRPLQERAKAKPRRPDWDRWRELVEVAYKRAFDADYREYKRERLERREAKAQRRMQSAGCAPVNTDGGQPGGSANRAASACGNGGYDKCSDAPPVVEKRKGGAHLEG